MPGLEDPERAVAAQARVERLQRACGGLSKPEARFTDLSDAHMGAAQQTLYDLTGTDALRAPPQCAAQHGLHHDQQCAWSPSHACVSPQGLFATQEVHAAQMAQAALAAQAELQAAQLKAAQAAQAA